MDWSASGWYVVLLVLMVCGLALQLMGLPGLWLMAGSALAYAWWTDFVYLSWPGLIAIFVLAGVAEVLEFVAGAGGAKSAGGSKRAMVFGTVGGIVGGILLTIPVPIIGTIIGVCVGAFAGATLAHMTIEQDMEESARVGLGAAKGSLIGILTKLSIGCVIFVVAAIVALPFGATPAPAPAGPAQPPAPTTSPAPPATAPAEEEPATLPANLPPVERP